MKKIIFISLLLLPLLGLDCNFLEEDESCDSISSADQTAIQTIINNVATEINTDDYNGFMNLMHPDSNYYDGSFFDAAYFNTNLVSEANYTFSGFSFCGTTVTCTSNHFSGSYTSTFTMKDDGGNWRVLKWKEESSTMYENVSPPK